MLALLAFIPVFASASMRSLANLERGHAVGDVRHEECLSAPGGIL
jgi:hypothetical protein